MEGKMSNRRKRTVILFPSKNSNTRYTYVKYEGLKGSWFESGNIIARTQKKLDQINSGEISYDSGYTFEGCWIHDLTEEEIEMNGINKVKGEVK